MATTQLYYSSSAASGTLSTALSPATSGSTGSVVVSSKTGLPTTFPFTLLLDWNTPNAEVVTVTQASTGTGPFTFANSVRGDDRTAAVSHGIGATVVHGVSARDFQMHRIVVNLLTFGGDPTNTNDNSTALTNAITACFNAGGGIVYIPPGTYKFTAGNVPAADSVMLLTNGYGTVIFSYTGTGVNPHLFDMDSSLTGGTGHIEDFEIHGVTINATGGDIYWGANVVRNKLIGNCHLPQSNGFATWNVQSGTGTHNTGYMAECEFNNKEQTNGPARTIEAWHLDFSYIGSLACNDNWWHGGGSKIWASNGGDSNMPWLRLMGAPSGQTGSRQNRFEKLVFEYPLGGMIRLQNTTGCIIEDVTHEDMTGHTAGTNPMIWLGGIGGGDGCNGITIRNYGRRGGPSNTMPTDIQLNANCSQIEITTPSVYSGGPNLIVDLGSAANVSLNGAWPAAYTILNESASTLYSNWTPGSAPQPEDLAYAGWAYDPAPVVVTGSALATAGVVFLVKVPLRMAKNVSTIRVAMTAAGATLTAGQCFAGLYSSSGSKLAATADQATTWAGATGNVDMALTGAPILIQPPFVWVAFVFNGTTGPSFLRGNASTNNLANGNTTAAFTRFGSILTGQTSLPASITTTSIARISQTYWAAIF